MAFSKTVNIRFKSFLPGAGYDSGGRAKQGKTNVRGQVAVVDYKRGGASLTARDLGLSTIDDINLKLVDPVRGADPAVNLRFIEYASAPAEFYVFEWRQDHTQFYLTGGVKVNVQGIREVPNTADFTFSFDAFGDSVLDTELT